MIPPRSRHRKPRKSSDRQKDLLAWLELQMAHPGAASHAVLVVGQHRGLLAWMHEAEQARVLPYNPFRLPGDERPGGVAVGGGVSVSREPDDWMLEVVAARLDGSGLDPEHLEPVRQHLTSRLGELTDFYLEYAGTPLPQRWEPLAVRLGDLFALTGTADQVAANYLATSILSHHSLAITAFSLSAGICKSALMRWKRLAEHYTTTLDEQRTRAAERVIQSVGEDDVRRFG